LDDVDLYLVDNFKTASQLMDWIHSIDDNTVMGFDTETHGLDIYAPHAKLRMVQIGDSHTGWAIPWDRWGGTAIECLDFWRQKNRRFTAHNLAYDYRVMKHLANYTLPWDQFDDTLIMAQIDAPGAPADLKTLTDKHVDPRASKGAVALNKAFKDYEWDWSNIPYNYPDYWIYSALDPVLANLLHKHYEYIPANFPQVYDLEYSVRHVCTEIEHKGMRIDLQYTSDIDHEYLEKIERDTQTAMDRWGINIASNPQLVEKFLEMGAEFSFITKGGSPSVSADQLDVFADDENKDIAELAAFVKNAKKTQKIKSSYFENFLSMNVDGVLYPSIKTLQAKTGRMSVTNPALQTLPSGDNSVRGAFIPRNPGETLVSCDYSQVEMRLLTHFSADENLILAFKTADDTGGDFFTEIGRIAYDDPNMDKDDKRRKYIKTLIYGIIYGASVKKSASTLGIPEHEMQKISDTIHAKFPGIREFMDKTIEMGDLRERDEGVAYTVLEDGRVLPTEKRSSYRLVNYTLQGTAARLMKLAVLRLDAAGLTPYILMIIHDEVIFSIPDELLDYYFPIIQECMSYDQGEYAVDLIAEPEILGKRWGDGHKYAA